MTYLQEENMLIVGKVERFPVGRHETSRLEVIKLPIGKRASFVGRNEAPRWEMGMEQTFTLEAIKPSGGKVESFPVERNEASRRNVMNLSGGKGGSFPVRREEAYGAKRASLPVGSD